MPWGSSSKIKHVNIVSNNYSRYGTSVYYKLYDNEQCDKVKQTSSNNNNNPYHNSYDSKKEVEKEPVYKQQHNSLNSDPSSKKSKIRNKYRSLITSSSRKLKNKLHDSSDSFSIFSSKSQHSRKKIDIKEDKDDINSKLFSPIRFPESYYDINALPVEILSHILSFIEEDSNSLTATLYVSKIFYEASKSIIYKNPILISTYRVAQFVTSLRLHPENGKYVKYLDLSKLKNGIIMTDPLTELDGSTNRDSYQNNILLPSHDHPTTSRGSNVRFIINGLENENDNNDQLKTSKTQEPEVIQDIAYAGWRDWRYRNDPLYSSPALNSYNMKRVVSRSSSVYSTSSANTSNTLGGRTRSSSSVSSITSSIMSSFRNSSHLSLTNTLTSTNSSPTRSLSHGKSYTRLTSKSLNQNVKSTTHKKNTKDISKWDSLKFRIRNRRSLLNSQENAISTTISYTNTNGTNRNSLKNAPVLLDPVVGGSRSSTPVPILARNSTSETENSFEMNQFPQKITFCAEKPFKSRHPYTNKFLLKYAPYRDLPLGYILHILNHCQNLIDINLSNIVLFNDFKVINNTGARKMSSPLLPSVKESEISSSAEDSLDVVYMTDSCKNFETYESNNANTHRLNSNINFNKNWMTSVTKSGSECPLPIYPQNKLGEGSRRQSKNSPALLKLNPSEIFEFLLEINKHNTLENIQLDGSIWCRQHMIKYFILNTLKKRDLTASSNEKPLTMSFLKSGMNRNFPWSCKGNLLDITAIIVLDEILKVDDFKIEELFQIKSEKYYESIIHTRDPSILEISNIFPIEYSKTQEQENTINFRLAIVKSDQPTSYKISKISSQNVSICVRLCMDENFNRVPASNEHLPKDPIKRIDRLTHNLVARVKELRNTELRRNIGENNYLRENIR